VIRLVRQFPRERLRLTDIPQHQHATYNFFLRIMDARDRIFQLAYLTVDKLKTCIAGTHRRWRATTYRARHHAGMEIIAIKKTSKKCL
jgi:hypothetical protein